MAKMVKLVNKDKTMCNELHKELNMQGFPAEKVDAKRRWMSGAKARNRR